MKKEKEVYIIKVSLSMSMEDFGSIIVKEQIYETSFNNVFSIPCLTKYKGAENGSYITFEIIGKRLYKSENGDCFKLVKEELFIINK